MFRSSVLVLLACALVACGGKDDAADEGEHAEGATTAADSEVADFPSSGRRVTSMIEYDARRDLLILQAGLTGDDARRVRDGLMRVADNWRLAEDAILRAGRASEGGDEEAAAEDAQHAADGRKEAEASLARLDETAPGISDLAYDARVILVAASRAMKAQGVAPPDAEAPPENAQAGPEGDENSEAGEHLQAGADHEPPHNPDVGADHAP